MIAGAFLPGGLLTAYVLAGIAAVIFLVFFVLQKRNRT
jgi:hypothetical protein